MAEQQSEAPINVESNAENPIHIDEEELNEGEIEQLDAGKTRAKIWAHYTRFKQNGQIKAKCKYCGAILSADPKNNGTSGLNAHNRRCKIYPPNVELRNQAILNFKSASANNDDETMEGESTNNCLWKFDVELTRAALAYMILVDELPFKFVENEGFRHFVSIACPRFNVPSRHTITRDCFKIYMEEKKKLKSIFNSSSQRICITTDTWTSMHRLNYMVVTAHYIDDKWRLRKKIINFVPILSHKGEAIGMAIENCLIEWGIKRVFTITVDNASSNDVAISYLKNQLQVWGHSVCENKFIHVRCVAHILNLVVVDGLKDVNISVARVRALIRWVRQSPSRIRKFKECVDFEKIENKSSLILDVATRWNSTYSMLNVAQHFERAFNRLGSRDPLFKQEMISGEGWPTVEDWGNVRRIVLFLKHFYELTLRISGTLYVTSNGFVHEFVEVDGLLKEMEDDDDYQMREMAMRMRSKLMKYWGDVDKMNKLLYIAVVLDPRHKFTFVEFVFNHMYGKESDLAIKMIRGAKDVLFELFNYYNLNHLSSQGHSSQTPSGSGSVTRSGGSSLVESMSRKKRKIGSLFEQHVEDEQGGEVQTELEMYLKDRVERKDEKFNLLAWWRSNTHRFPVLSLMARDVLAIPISTVASESAFSTGGRILDSFRSSLTPRMVQGIICAQDWLRRSNEPIDIEEKLESLEEIEKGTSQ